jgi:hypothetical protein
MVCRSSAAEHFIVSDWITPSAMEAVRERAIPGTILFHAQPLGNYAVTVESVRNRDCWRYVRDQTLLMGSFCEAIHNTGMDLHPVLSFIRRRTPYSGHLIVLAAAKTKQLRFLLRCATMRDWWYALRFVCRHPSAAIRICRSTRECRMLCERLAEQTAKKLSKREPCGRQALEAEWFFLALSDFPADGTLMEELV